MLGINLLIVYILTLTPTFASDESIKEGLKFVTSGAKVGPQIACAEDENPQITLSSEFSENGADCSGFIDESGQLGKQGLVISQHIDELGEESLFHNEELPGLSSVCPGWSELSRKEKSYFWVWLMAAISWKESTCGADTINSAATHGVAVGLLQLNRNKKDRYWRGGPTGDSCAVNIISTDENNLKCGLEILNEQLKGPDGIYDGNGNLFGRGAHSYWHNLRLKTGGTVIQLVRDFPPCKNFNSQGK